jgi:DNA ligase-1
MAIPDGFKPLLAIEQSKVKVQPENLYMSEKLDGIRCVVFGGVGYSRSLKPIPNASIQAYFKQHADVLEGVDGELIVGDKNAPDVFNQSTSGVMRQDGQPAFNFWIFDEYDSKVNWLTRFSRLEQGNHYDGFPSRVKLLQHFPVQGEEDMRVFESEVLTLGGEGIMLRDADGKYKCGRSGTKTPELQKVKRFVDKEFLIIGYEPKYHNSNEAKTNELGRTERSTAKAGMIPLDTMGALILETEKGLVFTCGSGFTDDLRAKLWLERSELKGKLAKVKYFDVGNGYSVPRFPVLVGIRHKDDL